MPIREDTETSNQSRKHPVPQNVMDVEFKVVGDLTVRQMMYLFAGGILVFVFHKSGLPLFWRWVLMIFSGGLAIAVAFIPIQERGLDKWLISFVASLFTPTQRVWRKSYSPPVYFLADYAQIIKNEILTLTPAKSRNKLDEYLGNIRNVSSDFEKDEIEQLSHVKMLLSQSSTSTVTTTTTTAPTLPSMGEMTKDEQESKEEYAKAYHESKGSPQIQIDRPLVHTSAEMAKEIPIHTKTTIPSMIAEEDVVDIAKKEAELKKNVSELLSITKKAREQLTHTTTNEEHKEMRLAFFTKKFSELESEHSTLTAKIEEKKKTMSEQQGDELSDYAKRAASLQKENEILEKELAEIQNQINSIRQAHVEKPKPEFREVKPLPSTPPTPQPKQTTPTPPLQKQNVEEKKPLDAGITIPQSNIASTGPAPVARTQVTSQQTAKQPDQLLPNILSGVVKSATGALIDSAVILLKNESGDVVRALKSNKIGQFKTQTPLSKGRYTIETVKGKEKFDILSVEVTGAVLSPLHIIAKEAK